MRPAKKEPLTATRGTPAGEGGISVIIISGKGAGAFAGSRLVDRRGRVKGKSAEGRISYGFIAAEDGETIDEVVVAFCDEEHVEINCHGGIVPAERVLRSLGDAGVVITEDTHPDAMGIAAGAIEAEAFAALREARTAVAARVFAGQYGGMLSGAIRQAAKQLDEARIDEARQALVALRETAGLGLALARLTSIAIVGPANAGKSTLVNALAGYERNIVTDIAGTTRDAVEVEMAFLGVPVVLVDTAGVMGAGAGRDEEAAHRAQAAARRADATIVVIDANRPLPCGYAVGKGRGVVGANKADLGVCETTLASVSGWGGPVVAISAVTGTGLEQLREETLGLLGIGAAELGSTAGAVVFTARQLAHVNTAIEALGRRDRAASEALGECLRGA